MHHDTCLVCGINTFTASENSYLPLHGVTLLQLPGLLVEGQGGEVVLVSLVAQRVGDHLAVHAAIHDLCTDDVLHSFSDGQPLVQCVVVEDQGHPRLGADKAHLLCITREEPEREGGREIYPVHAGNTYVHSINLDMKTET